MATKKYMSLTRLQEYDEAIKSYIDAGDAATSTKLTNGTIVVKEAEHATTADSAANATNATNATHADSADTATTAGSATKATQDENGKNIVSTYETKADATAKLTEAKGYTDSVAATKADADHDHDAEYDAKGAADDALASAKSYADGKVAGLASTSSVTSAISTHNTSAEAHNDIRGLITELTTKLNQFLDVDDTTTDQLSEVLTLIENNKGTLESLTTSKVNVSDIIDNLTTNSSDKVLSAAQGVAIKSLIDALDAAVDTKANASDLTSHTGNKSNPHGVTKTQVGLGNVPNVATNDQTPTFTEATTLAKLTSGEKLSVAFGKISKAITDLIAHIGNKANPHGVTAAQVGADASGSAAQALTNAKSYTDEKVAANKVAVDSALSATSTNPVENKAVNSAITTATSAISANTTSINAHTTRITNLESKVGDGFEEITSEDIAALFA